MKKILCLLLLLTTAFSLTACIAQNQPYSNSMVYQDAEQKYYISFQNGKFQPLGDASFAAISPERNCLVAAISSGNENPMVKLYQLNMLTKEWTLMEERSGKMLGLACTDKLAISFIENDYEEYVCIYDLSENQLIFETKPNKVVFSVLNNSRYSIADSVHSLREYLGGLFGSDLSLAYSENGKLYVLKNGQTKAEMIYDYGEKEIELSYVSKDGNTVIWTETGEPESQVMLCQNGEVTVIGSYENSFANFYSVTGDKSWNIISYRKKTDVLYDGKIVETISDASPSSFDYANNGNALYMILDGDLYCLDKNGEKTRILTEVKSYRIENERILYCKDGVLYMAKINKEKIDDPIRIETDFDSYMLYRVQISENGKYVYYLSADNFLYAFYEGDTKPKRVASNVNACVISANGKDAFFLSDAETTNNYLVIKYTLQHYRYGKEATTISSEVLGIGVSSKYIDPNSLDYQEYIRQKDGTVYFDLMHYNGRKSKTVLQDLIQK